MADRDVAKGNINSTEKLTWIIPKEKNQSQECVEKMNRSRLKDYQGKYSAHQLY